MKKILCFLALTGVMAFSQTAPLLNPFNGQLIVSFKPLLNGSHTTTNCTPGVSPILYDSGSYYLCTATNTWTLIAAGSTAAFSTITGGTSTGQSPFIVGAGSSLTYTSTGTINATTLAGSSIGVSGTTIPLLNANNTFSGSMTATAAVNFSGATHTSPTTVVANVGSLPATCTAGDLAVVLAATLGQQLYECSTGNVWTQQLNSGGGVTGTGTTNFLPLWTASSVLGNSNESDNGINFTTTLPLNSPAFVGTATSNTGSVTLNGVTSGTVALGAADAAGPSIVYVLPSINGTTGQVLSDNGTITCPTYASGVPSACHQLLWANITTGSANPPVIHPLVFSATPTYTGSLSTADTLDVFQASGNAPIVMTANITSCTASGFTPGQYIVMLYKQDSVTGGWTFACTGFDTFTPHPAKNATTKVVWQFDGANYRLISAWSDAGYSAVTNVSTPSVAPPSGSIYVYGAVTGNTLAAFNSVGDRLIMPKCAGSTNTCASTDLSDTANIAYLNGAQTFTAANAFSAAGAASTPGLRVTGAPYTAGTGTTNFPQFYLNGGAGPTTFSTSGTELGINTPSGFIGNMMDFHVNGGASVAKLDYQGNLTVNSCTGCGGGGGANTALSNLAAVAINTSLLSGASGVALGAAATPFSDLFLYGSATYGTSNYFHFGGTPTAARLVSLPDAASNTVQGISNPSDTQVVNYIGTDGQQHRIAQSGSGGGTAVAPYSTTVSAQTSVSILQTTHGQGTLAVAYCYDNATNRNAATCPYTRNSSGDLVFTFTPAFTGLIEVGSGGGTTALTADSIGVGTYATSSSAANTYAATITTAPSGYTTGSCYYIIFTNANTGAATINLNSLGAKNLTRTIGLGGVAQALVANDIPAGAEAHICYDGTEFQVLSIQKPMIFEIPGVNTAVVNGTPQYLGPFAGPTPTQLNRVMLAGYPITFSTLKVSTTSSQSGTGSLTCTLNTGTNGANPTTASALTVTVATSSAAGIYSDTTHSVGIAANDTWEIECVQNTGGTSAVLQAIALLGY